MNGAINILAEQGGSFWLPPRASTYSPQSDWLFWFIMWICVFFFCLVTVLIVVFSLKYRHRPGKPVETSPNHNNALELTWTLIPIIIVIFIFYYGFTGYLTMAVPPPYSMDIVVYASQWKYNFLYPNGHIDSELHVPLNKPVQFVLTSSDVIHGFYVPVFRVKKDIVPGRYNKVWAEANVPGTYDIYCTQYCGQGHSQMRATLVVQTQQQYDAWLAKATLADQNLPPIEHGKKLYSRNCIACHTIDGSEGIGPTWKNLYGHDVDFADGSRTIADENYLRSMIVNPNNRIVKGFTGVMPQQSTLNERTHDIDDLIAYIKSLSDKGPPPTTAPSTRP